MTTDELLRFAGSVLGPALIAQRVSEMLRLSVEPPANPPKGPDAAARLLRDVFPDGLEL